MMGSPCSDCGGQVAYQTLSREFEREGMTVSVSGIRALVCQQCGEVYFEPGGAQALVEAADSLFRLGQWNRQHKGKLSAAVPA
ncbi:MAG: YgiT-type zinc finger protein [Armatimonadetes bacterium]|nr:YgiT-type zinc finger protein [Armatimonadota bacterium]